MEHLTETLHESRTETKCNNIVTDTKDKVLLLTMNRDRTKEERLKYLEFRKQEQNDLKRKWKKVYWNYKQNASKVRVKPKKSSNRIKLWDWKTTNTEHLNPRSRWWSNDLKNLKKSNIVYHDHKHWYFWNKVLHEQLEQVIWDNFTVMHKETRDIITKAINHIVKYFIDKKKFYDPDTFKNPHFIP